MKITLTAQSFLDKFRVIRPNQFSYEGLQAVFGWYESLEEESGAQFEFDPIGISCEWTEYDNLKQFQSDYSKDYTCIEDISNETSVLELEHGFIVREF